MKVQKVITINSLNDSLKNAVEKDFTFCTFKI